MIDIYKQVLLWSKSWSNTLPRFSDIPLMKCFRLLIWNVILGSVTAAHRIKDHIKDELGFTVNIGISTNKLLAKMAGDFEKPDKVHTLFPHEIKEKCGRFL